MEAVPSFESLNEEETAAVAGSSRRHAEFELHPPREDIVPRSPPPSVPLSQSADRSSSFDDLALNEVTTSVFVIDVQIVNSHYAPASLNPFHSTSDQRQSSLCNINAFSVGKVRRINDMITQNEFLW